MYRKEKGLMANAAKQFSPRKLNAPIWTGSQVVGGFSSGSSGGRGSSSRTLPPPVELAGRIEEARTSAKLLLQLVQSTPANELLNNELVKEFAERCTMAQRSIHGYIACDNPAPDDDTMLTLIETNEQLSLAASKHQRAVLQSRRLMGASPSPAPSGSSIPAGVPPPPHNDTPSIPPVNVAPAPPLEEPRPALPPNKPQQSPHEENPFADHYTSSYTPPAAHQNPGAANEYVGSPNSYHPGYQPTPSYLGRQESSANNLTMHGAQPPITEEDDHGRPRTPELNVPQQQAHDVSPIAERNTVTYRY